MASANELGILPELPPATVTPVNVPPRSASAAALPLQPLARLVASQLFPGNFGGIDYRRLNQKVQRRDGDYEPMAADVRHYVLETPVGSVVGFHVYPAAVQPRQVVIFCHGNIRPSRYMNKFLEQLSGNRQRVVVARDFVGYDLSSCVPNRNGALEVAASSNDRAVYDWAVQEYPEAEIVVGGRSVGNMGWANLIALPRVSRVFGIVPFAEPAGVVASFIVPGVASWIPGLSFALRRLSNATCDVAFPSGSEYEGAHATVGFSTVRTIENLPSEHLDRQVLLFKAANDELVPSTDADLLAQKLRQQLSIEPRIVTLAGGHRALPGDGDNPAAREELEDFLSGIS